MKVKAIVNYPVFVDMDIPDSKFKKMDKFEIDLKVLKCADAIFESSSIEPEIENGSRSYEDK